MPWSRLDELLTRAERYGAALVLDNTLQDGLVVGGWKRHRHLSPDATEIELYEGESEDSAELKDKTQNEFETALSTHRRGFHSEAVRLLLAIVRQNPFDRGALALLGEWETTSKS